MRHLSFLLLALTALSLPAAAQQAPGKSKTPQARTYVDTLDMSSGAAVVREFVEAYAADDFFKAYMLLSPGAKSAFANKIFEYNDNHLFPGMTPGDSVLDPYTNALPGADILQDTNLDGPSLFDTAMLNAQAKDLAPFDFKPGVPISPTFEHEAEARYLVSAIGSPDTVVITAIKLSNGDWRVERIVWPRSDPAASPWGFK